MDWLGKTRNPLTIYSSSGFPVSSRAVLGTFWRGCDARCCTVPALQRFRPSVPCGSGTPRPLSCFAGLGACMWSVSSLPSTRRDRAVTRKSKYLNFDRRHRMRRLSTFSLNSSVFELACAARVLGNNVAIAEKLVFIGRQSFKAHWTAGMKLTCADT